MPAPDPNEMICQELVELVTDYEEGTLPVGDRTRLEMHLCFCTPCRVYLQQMRETVRLAGRLTGETLPAAKEELLAVFRGWRRSGGGT